LTCRRIQNYI